jgi:hypothetical protein
VAPVVEHFEAQSSGFDPQHHKQNALRLLQIIA